MEVFPVNLQAGENIVTITTTSLSGDKAVYELEVTNQETAAQPATDLEKADSGEEGLNTQNVQETEEKGGFALTGRMAALFAGLTVALILLLSVQFLLSHKKKMRKKKNRKKAAPELQVSSEEKTENIELLGVEEELPVVDNREIEIAVKHVTMEFKKEKDESSSIKELAVRTLKGQRHVEKFLKRWTM